MSTTTNFAYHRIIVSGTDSLSGSRGYANDTQPVKKVVSYPVSGSWPRAHALLSRPAWLHQCEFFAKAAKRRASLIPAKMGSGKTLIALWLAAWWGSERVLILSPKSVTHAWNASARVGMASPLPMLNLADIDGSRRRVAAAIAHQTHVEGPQAVVLHYEAAIQPEVARWLLSQRWALLIAYESHRLKAPSGVASKLVAKLAAKADRVLCLTGTPCPHSPLDIWAQGRILDPTVYGPSYTRFRSRYAVLHPSFPKVLEWRNMDEWRERYWRLALDVPEPDLSLPDATHQLRTGRLSNRAQRVYRQLEDELWADLREFGGGEVTLKNVLGKVLRLQQVTGGWLPSDDAPSVRVDHEKGKLLADLFEDLPPDEAIVVFARFRADLDTIHEAAAKVGRESRELSGRRGELLAWQGGEGNVLAVQMQSGGVGVDLTRARYCIYYSVGYSLGDYLQSLARVHRPGQTRPVTYVHLVLEGTIDETVYEALSSRKEVIDGLLARSSSGGRVP